MKISSPRCPVCFADIADDAHPLRRYCSKACRQKRWESENTAAVRATRWVWYQGNRNRAAALARERYLRNRDWLIELSRSWSKANPERKRVYQRGRQEKLRTDNWTAEDFALVRSMLEGSCAYCGATGDLTLDHVVPLDRGGAHRVENLVAACRPCNSRKSNKDELEFRALLALEAFVEGANVT